MSNAAIVVITLAMSIAVVTLSSLLVFKILKALRRQSDRPLSLDTAGTVRVPVRRLRWEGFLSHSVNGISPRLEIAPDGLRFKIFKSDYWPFTEISEVNAVRTPFATRLSIKNRSGQRLYVDLADRAKARDFLRSLPMDLDFTARAIAMRDGAT